MVYLMMCLSDNMQKTVDSSEFIIGGRTFSSVVLWKLGTVWKIYIKEHNMCFYIAYCSYSYCWKAVDVNSLVKVMSHHEESCEFFTNAKNPLGWSFKSVTSLTCESGLYAPFVNVSRKAVLQDSITTSSFLTLQSFDFFKRSRWTILHIFLIIWSGSSFSLWFHVKEQSQLELLCLEVVVWLDCWVLV